MGAQRISPTHSAGVSPRSPESGDEPVGAAAAIGVDPEFAGEHPTDDDNDSALGDSESMNVLGSTASISSTILDYRKLHGRTYQNYDGVEYWGPNDERQNQGLDIAHHMLYVAFDNKLFLAPIDNPQKVLDIGTGTGIWAVDFADEFPSAEVLGTDVSPIQPTWVPPNCKFEMDNCELPWTYREQSFDYIHIRGMVGCVQDWEKLYREAYRCLKPGGWLELQEYALPIEGNEAPLPEDCVWHAWGDIFRQAGRRMGRTFEVTDHWEGWLRGAGFTGELGTSVIRLPIGGWAADPKWKEVGLFNRMSLEQGLEGFATYICTMVLGWKQEEVTVLLAKVRNAIKNKSYHAFYPLKTIYTQKPLAE